MNVGKQKVKFKFEIKWHHYFLYVTVENTSIHPEWIIPIGNRPQSFMKKWMNWNQSFGQTTLDAHGLEFRGGKKVWNVFQTIPGWEFIINKIIGVHTLWVLLNFC